MSASATAAAWVGACATGGALMIAAGAYAQQVRDRRREHASRISAWVDGEYIAVTNTSDEPFYEVVGEIDDIIGGGQLGRSPDIFRVLPPRSERRLRLPKEAKEVERSEAGLLDFMGRAAVEFTDRNGRRWRRASIGLLQRMDPYDWNEVLPPVHKRPFRAMERAMERWRRHRRMRRVARLGRENR